jgi:hypothetical protein
MKRTHRDLPDYSIRRQPPKQEPPSFPWFPVLMIILAAVALYISLR